MAENRGRTDATNETRAKGTGAGLGALALLAFCFLPLPGLAPAQGLPNPSRAHMALNSAIESHRRGDYEQAAGLFQQAMAWQDDLSPGERQELTRVMQLNAAALQARQTGAEQLRQAEKALQEGRPDRAGDLLKRVTANQYLLPADRQKAQLLWDRLRPSTAATGAAGNSPLALARTKLQQGRALLAQGNFDAAEQLAREADSLKATYPAQEDNPAKLLHDISHARTDAKGLVAKARDALKAGDYDRAERLANLAKKAESSWSMHLFGDSADKVLKDIQMARARIGGKPGEVVRQTVPPAEKEPSGLFSPMRNVLNRTKPEPSVSAKQNETPANPPSPYQPQQPVRPMSNNPNTEAARQLLAQARKALQQGNLDEATRLTEQARKLKPELPWWEDNPEKLMADIQRQSAAGGRPAAGGPPQSRGNPNGQAEGRKPAANGPAEDPRALVRQGRELFAQGKYDEADKVARRARQLAGSTRWGLFEDSPDKLAQDLDKAKAKRNQEESGQVLAEGRKLLAKGDLEGAARAAYRAEHLHGPYSVWDLGDRPQKLLADVEAAKKKQRTPVPPLPPAGYARNEQRPGSNPPPQGAVDPRVAQLMGEAWAAVQQGDRARAQALLTQAEGVQAGLKRPPDQGMVALRQALAHPNSTYGAQPPAQGTVVDPNKQQAVQLLAQCRQLQQQGQLVEARAKAVEAMKLNVAFGSNEDSPQLALLQLAAQAQQRIDALARQAADLTAAAASDPTRYGMAENCLLQAQHLAAGFGLDAQPIESRLAWVRQNAIQRVSGTQEAEPRNPLEAQPPAQVRITDQLPGSQAVTPDSLQGTGRGLLAQAREKLRAGKINEARQIAEQVYAGPYGAQKEALAIIRGIDAEEFNQKRLAAGRTFDAAHSAFQRKEYAYSAALLRSIDPRLLDADRQGRLKEMMALPEMQPSALAHGTEPAAPSDGPKATDANPGVVQVTDTAPRSPENDFARQVLAMQEVKFQELRSKGLEAQNRAAEAFRSGDTARALEILQEFLASLASVQLESDRVAMLRRPIESRLQQFRTLQAQKEFEELQVAGRQARGNSRNAIEAAERNKQEKVAELMKQFNALYKEGKYKEAQYKAMLVKEIDPDNTAATAAIYMAKMQMNKTEAQRLKDGREEMFLGGTNDSEDEGPFTSVTDPLKFDNKRWEIVKNRPKDLHTLAMRGKGPREREIENKLLSPVNLNFQDTPLRQVIDDISSWQGIDMVPDLPALQEEGISLDRPITMKLQGVSLKSALKLMLEQVRLTYVVQDEVLKITTPNHAQGQLVQRVYQVADLVIPLLQATSPADTLTRLSNGQAPSPIQVGTMSAGNTPYVSRSALSTGQPVGVPGAGGDPFAAAAAGQGQGGQQVLGAGSARMPSDSLADQLIQLIKNSIKPRSWNDQGGPGTIDYFPMTLALVINQTLDIHEQIADLLDALRRLQDQEVAVEVRFITVAEGFFERIGLDFNINIKTDRETARFEPQITTGQFKPAGFINDFKPSRFIAGLTPAGTFTSDLDIPIRTSSFGQAIPPFGPFLNSPGANGGIELGLAFLSDIQVFMFMEAAQGDQRTNVMQAPKVTLFNGQTASIFVMDQQFFVTNVTVIQNGGQLAFVPQNQNFAIGVNLTLQAVISADRRFVRLNLNPSITNLASAIVPLFPIVTPIFPVFDGGFPGNPVLFTQFIQQPVFDTISVQTSVAVPDGGTVLIGGLKRLSEGRNEFGPPVLSKIPYINRLFKNVGYGREVESLMLMVTPRIIIKEEEEFRQTGQTRTPRPEF
jgi:type II secretory pathway component GspD/PulD (secretin)